jgi:NTE family protein
MSEATEPTTGVTAFVLGGGGLLGAAEVGMLRALFEAGVRPDLILGTSVGALNGALVAADPGPGVIERLAALWESAVTTRDVYGDGAVRQVTRAVRTGTHLHSSEPLRDRLAQELGDLTFAELAVPFQCCAASIEAAAEHWFTHGRVVDAVVASAAVPGLLPPALVDGVHYLDGGIVNSIPVGRAVECGASRVFVLQVGRVDRPLTAPRKPWEVARVSFEIARRHRFHREMAELPEHVDAHVLPTGGGSRKDDSLLAYRDFRAVSRRIDAAYHATAAYLGEHLGQPDRVQQGSDPDGHR